MKTICQSHVWQFNREKEVWICVKCKKLYFGKGNPVKESDGRDKEYKRKFTLYEGRQ